MVCGGKTKAGNRKNRWAGGFKMKTSECFQGAKVVCKQVVYNTSGAVHIRNVATLIHLHSLFCLAVELCSGVMLTYYALTIILF